MMARVRAGEVNATWSVKAQVGGVPIFRDMPAMARNRHPERRSGLCPPISVKDLASKYQDDLSGVLTTFLSKSRLGFFQFSITSENRQT
jgi:hypothetical protein